MVCDGKAIQTKNEHKGITNMTFELVYDFISKRHIHDCGSLELGFCPAQACKRSRPSRTTTATKWVG